ncbi:hypothetical protein [Archangium sp. Cb G35]|uniref:hypothetical protein n=1 Tax=Archangium sp. Cb G35 TaxID=1920190 RepID=UPI00116101C4|nr:hypothetical protein [Archangium sp. Cb G35]
MKVVPAPGRLSTSSVSPCSRTMLDLSCLTPKSGHTLGVLENGWKPTWIFWDIESMRTKQNPNVTSAVLSNERGIAFQYIMILSVLLASASALAEPPEGKKETPVELGGLPGLVAVVEDPFSGEREAKLDDLQVGSKLELTLFADLKNRRSRIKGWLLSSSDSWRYLNCHTTALLVDSRRTPLTTTHDGDVLDGGGVIEFVEFSITRDELVRWTKAKSLVGKVCNDVFELNEEALQTLRIFAETAGVIPPTKRPQESAKTAPVADVAPAAPKGGATSNTPEANESEAASIGK